MAGFPTTNRKGLVGSVPSWWMEWWGLFHEDLAPQLACNNLSLCSQSAVVVHKSNCCTRRRGFRIFQLSVQNHLLKLVLLVKFLLLLRKGLVCSGKRPFSLSELYAALVACREESRFYFPSLNCTLTACVPTILPLHYSVQPQPRFSIFSSQFLSSAVSHLHSVKMSAKSCYEADGKAILSYHLTRSKPIGQSPLPSPPHNSPPKLASLHFPPDCNPAAVLDAAETTYSFLLAPGARFVAKPDQLIKRRGKLGLLTLNKTWPEARKWVEERACKEIDVEGVKGILRHFLVEPFVPHKGEEEYYINIHSVREGDWILFTHEGGVDVGDVDAKAERILIGVDLNQFPPNETIAAALLKHVPKGVHNVLIDFILRLYAVYVDCQFTYLEINPLVVIPNEDKTSAEVYFLDLAAKLDQTAEFECGAKWAIARSSQALGLASASTSKVSIDAGPPMEFPAPFGRELSPEEAYIASLDAKTGASLKLTVLNPQGRIWTLVAGGGASVVYADAIASAGFTSELANYGEYSGAPTETQTYHYARTVFDLMLRGPILPEGKVLFIGGGIANFTNVASTFKGVIRAIREFAPVFLEHKVQIWVRRAGPNYQEGLKNIKAVGRELNLSMKVYGPEMHVSGIVPMALLGKNPGNIKEYGA